MMMMMMMMMNLTIVMIDDMIIKTKLLSKDLIVLPFRDKNKIIYLMQDAFFVGMPLMILMLESAPIRT